MVDHLEVPSPPLVVLSAQIPLEIPFALVGGPLRGEPLHVVSGHLPKCQVRPLLFGNAGCFPLLGQPLEFSQPPSPLGTLPGDVRRAVLQGNILSLESLFLRVAFCLA